MNSRLSLPNPVTDTVSTPQGRSHAELPYHQPAASEAQLQPALPRHIQCRVLPVARPATAPALAAGRGCTPGPDDQQSGLLGLGCPLLGGAAPGGAATLWAVG